MAQTEKMLYEFTEDRWFLNTFYKKGQQALFYPAQVEFEGHSIITAPAPVDKGKSKKSDI